MISAERPISCVSSEHGVGFLSCQSPPASNQIMRLHPISFPKSSGNTLFGENLLSFVRIRGISQKPVTSRATRRFQNQCCSLASPLSQMGLSDCNFSTPAPWSPRSGTVLKGVSPHGSPRGWELGAPPKTAPRQLVRTPSDARLTSTAGFHRGV